jgi:hypothetical protein
MRRGEPLCRTHQGGPRGVVSTSLHAEGTLVDAQGRRVILARSGGGIRVLVLVLADGTTHAIGVGYPGISQTAMAFPWEVTLSIGDE